jgi:hypothetical protein
MAESTSVFNTPTLWINQYLQEKIGLDTGIGVPFFPAMPASIDDLTETWVTVPAQYYGGDLTAESQRLAFSGVMATWDRLIRMRRSPFPHIKQEQVLYYFYGTEAGVTEKMVQVQEKVLRLMDREDETAAEINAWTKGKEIDGMTCKFYFHRFKIYQLEEVRDIIDFGTARTYGGNKIIIDFEYHQDTSLMS